MRCDLLRPEVARLTIVGAANSSLSAEELSPLQTGNIKVCGAKLTWSSMRPLLDKACKVGGSGMDADLSLDGDCSCKALIGIMLEALLMLVRSSLDPISPLSAFGNSQVAARLYYSSVTSSREFLMRSAQFGGTWLLFMKGTVVNRSSKTT